jgi:NAD(P)-dependent dehydrogenase (short-subunit alcohol dehydrogenase family)
MLEGKRIVVIGGTGGIGLSAVQAFLAAGARVVATGNEESSCRQTSEMLPDRVSLVLCRDARKEGTTAEVIRRCVEKFDGFDALYHVAGGSGRRWGDGPLHRCTLEGWNRTLELNLTSLMLSNQAAVRYWLEQERGGAVLNLSSVLACAPSPEHFSTHAYAAAKSAVIGFTRSLAAYYAPADIRFNVLAPALTETPMAQRAITDPEISAFIRNKQPLDGGRVSRPDDLDGAACYFLSDQARFTTGQVLAVDGGWSVSEGRSRSDFESS